RFNEPGSTSHLRCSVPRSAKRQPGARIRSTVVDPKCRVKISNARVARIFQELRSMKVDNLPNSVAVMLRVFLEFTVEQYMDSKQMPKLPHGRDTLSHKLLAVVQYLK